MRQFVHGGKCRGRSEGHCEHEPRTPPRRGRGDNADGRRQPGRNDPHRPAEDHADGACAQGHEIAVLAELQPAHERQEHADRKRLGDDLREIEELHERAEEIHRRAEREERRREGGDRRSRQRPDQPPPQHVDRSGLDGEEGGGDRIHDRQRIDGQETSCRGGEDVRTRRVIHHLQQERIERRPMRQAAVCLDRVNELEMMNDVGSVGDRQERRRHDPHRVRERGDRDQREPRVEARLQQDACGDRESAGDEQQDER
jgi:hypothetical protein